MDLDIYPRVMKYWPNRLNYDIPHDLECSGYPAAGGNSPAIVKCLQDDERGYAMKVSGIGSRNAGKRPHKVVGW